MLKFNDLLLREHNFGDGRMYKVMRDMEEYFEYLNKIEMVKANANRTEYSRTLRHMKNFKKVNLKLREERKFRMESMKKLQDTQSKYRQKCRDQKYQMKEINELEIENKQMRKDVEFLQDSLGNITVQLNTQKAQFNVARDLVWSSVRNVGSDKRGKVRERSNYNEKRMYTEYNTSDSEDSESLREHALQETSRWEDDDVRGRSKRADPSRYPRSKRKDFNERGARCNESYNTPGYYNFPKSPQSPKVCRNRSPWRGRHSPPRRTTEFDDFDNKCEDPIISDSPEADNDDSRLSRSVRGSTNRTPTPSLKR